MGQELPNKLSTTELLKLNISDFFEEVKQDYLFNKYCGFLETGSQIFHTELENYLSRITNKFDAAESIFNDIYTKHTILLMRSRNRSCELPILQTIYNILLDEIESKICNDTFENLKKDSSYKNEIIEEINLDDDTFEEAEHSKLINECKLNGYNRAVEAFNSLKQKTNDKNENTDKSQRIIDSERLKDYFNSTFKGMGNGNIDYFNTFIDELKRDRTAKTFAQIALMCHNGNQMSNRRPKTWQEWYSIFCECVQCEKKTYKPKDLKPIPENIEKLFNYLM